MKRVGAVNRLVLGAMLATLPGVLFAPAAGAQLGVESGAEEARAGITVNGVGLGTTKKIAANHAVGDARQRAASIAAVLGLDLGGVEAVYMPELAESARASRRCRRPSGCRKTAAARVTFGVVGAATDAQAIREVSASGGASVPVEPRDRSGERSIRRAIETARHAATKEAVATAARNAKTAADAAGLQLGSVVSVAEPVPAYYALDPPFYLPFPLDPLLGTSGPGTFCGTAQRTVIRRDPATGRPKELRRVSRRRCLVPREYEASVEIRYSAGRRPGV